MAFDVCVLTNECLTYLPSLKSRTFEMSEVRCFLLSQKLTAVQIRETVASSFLSSLPSESVKELSCLHSISQEVNMAVHGEEVTSGTPHQGYTVLVCVSLTVNSSSHDVCLCGCVSDEVIIADERLKFTINIEETKDVFTVRADFDGSVVQGLLHDNYYTKDEVDTLVGDIDSPDLSGYVTVGTNQTISSLKTFTLSGSDSTSSISANGVSVRSGTMYGENRVSALHPEGYLSLGNTDAYLMNDLASTGGARNTLRLLARDRNNSGEYASVEVDKWGIQFKHRDSTSSGGDVKTLLHLDTSSIDNARFDRSIDLHIPSEKKVYIADDGTYQVVNEHCRLELIYDSGNFYILPVSGTYKTNMELRLTSDMLSVELFNPETQSAYTGGNTTTLGEFLNSIIGNEDPDFLFQDYLKNNVYVGIFHKYNTGSLHESEQALTSSDIENLGIYISSPDVGLFVLFGSAVNDTFFTGNLFKVDGGSVSASDPSFPSDYDFLELLELGGTSSSYLGYTCHCTLRKHIDTAEVTLQQYSFEHGQEFIIGSHSSATHLWTGISKQEALYDGMCINYYLPYRYSSAQAVTLNLSMSNGSGGLTGEIPVKFNGTNEAKSQMFNAGAVVQLTYCENKVINGSSVSGWFANSYYVDPVQYDVNAVGYNIFAFSTGIFPGQICVPIDIDGAHYCSLVPFNTQINHVTQRYCITEGFYPFLFVVSNTSAPSGYSVDRVNLFRTTGVALNDHFALGVTWIPNNPIYLVCTFNQTDGKFYLDTEQWWSMSIPSSVNGKLYIYLGRIHGNSHPTGFFLDYEHPILRYKDGKIQEVTYASLINEARIDALESSISGSGGGSSSSSDYYPLQDVSVSRSQTEIGALFPLSSSVTGVPHYIHNLNASDDNADLVSAGWTYTSQWNDTGETYTDQSSNTYSIGTLDGSDEMYFRFNGEISTYTIEEIMTNYGSNTVSGITLPVLMRAGSNSVEGSDMTNASATYSQGLFNLAYRTRQHSNYAAWWYMIVGLNTDNRKSLFNIANYSGISTFRNYNISDAPLSKIPVDDSMLYTGSVSFGGSFTTARESTSSDDYGDEDSGMDCEGTFYHLVYFNYSTSNYLYDDSSELSITINGTSYRLGSYTKTSYNSSYWDPEYQGFVFFTSTWNNSTGLPWGGNSNMFFCILRKVSVTASAGDYDPENPEGSMMGDAGMTETTELGVIFVPLEPEEFYRMWESITFDVGYGTISSRYASLTSLSAVSNVRSTYEYQSVYMHYVDGVGYKSSSSSYSQTNSVYQPDVFLEQFKPSILTSFITSNPPSVSGGTWSFERYVSAAPDAKSTSATDNLRYVYSNGFYIGTPVHTEWEVSTAPLSLKDVVLRADDAEVIIANVQNVSNEFVTTEQTVHGRVVVGTAGNPNALVVTDEGVTINGQLDASGSGNQSLDVRSYTGNATTGTQSEASLCIKDVDGAVINAVGLSGIVANALRGIGASGCSSTYQALTKYTSYGSVGSIGLFFIYMEGSMGDASYGSSVNTHYAGDLVSGSSLYPCDVYKSSQYDSSFYSNSSSSGVYSGTWAILNRYSSGGEGSSSGYYLVLAVRVY